MESLGSDVALHSGEAGLGERLVTVAADLSEVGVPPKALDQIFHVGYLEKLSEHQRLEVVFRLIFY
jgi:hypothetical protein